MSDYQNWYMHGHEIGRYLNYNPMCDMPDAPPECDSKHAIDAFENGVIVGWRNFHPTQFYKKFYREEQNLLKALKEIYDNEYI